MNEEFKKFMAEVNEDNLREKVGEFISTVKNNYLTTLQTNILFNLHNNFLFPHIKELGKSCSSCRMRVWNRVKNWYDKNEKA